MVTLTDDGAQLLAEIEAWVKATEDRVEYRREHGRSLSADHVVQIKALRDRLDQLLVPAARETQSIDRDFERLRAAAERLT